MWCCSSIRSKPTKPEDTTPYQSPQNLKQTIRSCYSGNVCVKGNGCIPAIYMLHRSNRLRRRDWNKAHHRLFSAEAKVSLGTRQGHSISQFSLSLSSSLLLLSLLLPDTWVLDVVFISPHCNLTLCHGRLNDFNTAGKEVEQQLSIE